MTILLNALLVFILALNLFILVNSRLLAIIRMVAIQGAVIGALPLISHHSLGLPSIIAALIAVALKGIAIPYMLSRAMRDAQIKREVEPFIGFQASMILGALATAAALSFVSQMPLLPEHSESLLVPTSVATVIAGFILLVTRYKAISQVIGYLMLENGIFLFGLLLIEAMPLVVEMGVLLDMFVGVFVISIIVKHINRAFSTLDTRMMVELKE